MDTDRDHQAIAQAYGMAEHIEVTIGDGVEGAGIKRDAGHETVLPRPDRPGKPVQARDPIHRANR
jgi:hypothetical protein